MDPYGSIISRFVATAWYLRSYVQNNVSERFVAGSLDLCEQKLDSIQILGILLHVKVTKVLERTMHENPLANLGCCFYFILNESFGIAETTLPETNG